MTTWANATVNSGGSEKFHGDVYLYVVELVQLLC